MADNPRAPRSTPQTLAVTLERARGMGLETAMLPMWYDIDDEETLRLLISEIAGEGLAFDHGGLKGGPAVATSAFLAARPFLTAEARLRVASAGR